MPEQQPRYHVDWTDVDWNDPYARPSVVETDDPHGMPMDMVDAYIADQTGDGGPPRLG